MRAHMDNIGYLLSDRSRLLRRAFDERVRDAWINYYGLIYSEGESQ